jgi:hypothetical protein
MGNPSDSVISDDSIRLSINSALGELSRLQPYYVYHELSLTKGNSTYDVEEDIIDVKGFWFSPMHIKPVHQEWISLTGAEGVPDNEGYHEYAGLKVFHSPSLMNILEEKWDRLKSRQLMSWEFNPDTKKLLVIPAPIESGIAVYKGVIQRDITMINIKYEDAFKELVRALSMETWIFKISTIKSIPVGVGKVDYDTDNLTRICRTLKQEALKKLSGGGSGVVVG